MGGWGGQAVGEGVGGGVGVGRRVILVFLGVWRGKRGAGGFFRFFFLRGWSVAGQVFVLVCVKKEAAPLVWCGLEVMVWGRGALCGLFVVNVVMMRAWDVVAGAGRTWSGLERPQAAEVAT